MAKITPLLEMRNIRKEFPGVTALNNVNFDVLPGEVHILCGENGAGKSTLMKILSGAYQPTDGHLVIDGKEYRSLTPRESSQAGISIIYQELSVISELSIAENIFLGRLAEKKFLGLNVVDGAAMRKKTSELLARVGLNKKPDTLVGSLSIPEKQLVEIAKAVAFDAKVIIMDEPTSSLTENEVEKLFLIIRALQNEGRGIIYISHRLSELKKIGSRVSVLKDGQYVGTRNIASITEDEIITMMVGRSINERYNLEPVLKQGEPIFEVSHFTRKDKKAFDISFSLYKGEVLGFSGLIGAGRSELMNAIYGAEKKESGVLYINGKEAHITNTYDAVKQGIALLTENRRETGFLKNFSIKNNISIASYLKNSKWGGLYGLVNKDYEKKISEEQKEALSIKCASVEQNITNLSGGNQQKVILGKWIASMPRIIIFDEPTKGIDVGTKSEIYKLLRRLASENIGVIVVSSEMPELLAVCDRIIVFSGGRISGEFNGREATEEMLLKAATAKTGENAA
ncbi:MAG: sugar ABC transporter ATP-binding protein [Spirochaetaceae bacterium]|jgi:D-allose transport system ATP-binding protein|nr:sugar ABC transporter ATP-binding protein [Spirochaetaceae bacterium]